MADFSTVVVREPKVIAELPQEPKPRTRPLIKVLPEGLRFVTITLPGEEAEVQKLTITSVGTEPLKIGGYTDTSTGDFDLKIRELYKTELKPGESTTVNYAFRPTTRGDKSAIFTVTSNAENPEAGRATLSGLAKQKVKPVPDLASKAIALKGAPTKLTLSADVGDFDGKGVLTLVGSAKDKVKLINAGKPVVLEDGKVQFDLPATIVLDVEAVEASASVDDVVFQWELKEGGPYFAIQPPVTEKLTVVKATLDIHKKSGPALGTEEKMSVGRVIHVQNADNERSRAQITVTCVPAAFKGQLKLSAVKDIIAIYDAPKDGKKIDLPCTMDVGPGKTPAKLYVQGTTISGGARDTGLTLQIVDPALDADEVKITVVETKLELYEKRVDKKVDPIALLDSVKNKTGRGVYKQNPKSFICDRAKMRLTLAPHDAPCTVILKADADKLTLFPEKATLHVVPVTKPAYDEVVTLERHSSAEVKETIPMTLGPGKIPKDTGLVFWAEGKDLTARQLFQVDIEEVDDKCDAVAVKVELPRLDVKVVRSEKAKKKLVDTRDLSAAVTVKLTEGATGYSFDTDLKGDVHRDVEADEYAIGLELHGEEKGTKKEDEWRVTRIDPDDSQTRVMVKEPRTVKFELDPPYLQVQFIAYAMETGAYKGTDDPAAFTKVPKRGLEPERAATQKEQRQMAAVHDMEERCKIMDHAILQAKGNAYVKAGDSRVLKVFMAPEFYFRGQQGAYPIETVHNIMGMLKEPAKGDYADWIFVFGSALGYLELTDKGAKTTGTVTNVATSKDLLLSWKTGDPPAAITVGWNLWYVDENSSMVSTTLSWVDALDIDGATTRCWVETSILARLNMRYATKLKKGNSLKGEVEVVQRLRTDKLTVQSATPIVNGSIVEQGTKSGVVRKSTLIGADLYELKVEVERTTKFATGPIDFTVPGETETFNVALVKKGGTGTPVKSDGAGQKELLIYKEQISSVDFAGKDKGTQDFYKKHRHMAEMHGDANRRLLPTEGSTDDLGKNPNPQKVGGISEVNKSGLGGGMVFTMDGITFGVEVCLDHGQARLKNYYDPSVGGAPPASEPNVQIHLIPSCGVSIENPCVVTDGLVFNVDTEHEAAQDASGGDITELDDDPIVGGPSTAAYFPSPGRIVVYDPADRPKATSY